MKQEDQMLCKHNGKTYAYIIKRSNRKTIALHMLENKKLEVRAPYRVNDKIIQDFVLRHVSWIESRMDMLDRQKENMRYPFMNENELKLLAQRTLPGRVDYYSRIMGLYPKNIKITSAKKRLGSCSSTNNICFSYRLMQYDFCVVEYVVVHELAHIKHKNHGAQFYELIASVLPDYKQRIANMKGK